MPAGINRRRFKEASDFQETCLGPAALLAGAGISVTDAGIVGVDVGDLVAVSVDSDSRLLIPTC